MASTNAWNLGAEIASKNITAKRERKQALSDEQRQFKVLDLYAKGHGLTQGIAALGEGDPRRQSMMDALTDVESSLHDIYHPLKNPGALEKDWHFLAGLIHKSRPAPAVLSRTTQPGTPETTMKLGGQEIKLPATPAYQTVAPKPIAMTPQQRQLLARRGEARKRAELDVAAGGLSPEQEAAIDVRKTDAEIDAKMARFDKYYPDAPKDMRDRYRVGLLESSAGIKTPTVGTKWVTKTGTIDGQKVALMYDEKDPDGKLRYMNGQPVPDDLAGKFVPDAARVSQQGYKFDKVTGQVLDPSSGKRYNEGDPANPPDVKAMFDSMRATQADARKFQTQLAGLRAASYNASRPISSLDTANGNAPAMVPFSDYQKYPGRYLPASEADKAIPRENLMQDIAGTSQLTRQAIMNLQEDFPEDMKAKVAAAMYAERPDQYIAQLFASGALASLTPDQRQFMISAQQLAENAMAMRSILGAGQGAEDVRNAIRATLPSLLSPDRAYALAQLDAFDKTIARLHRGVPRVPLNATPFNVQSPEGGAPGTAGGGKGARSIAQAMQYWKAHPDKAQQAFGTSNPGEPQVIQDIQRRGYQPVRP
jgi:hypothetical protein